MSHTTIAACARACEMTCKMNFSWKKREYLPCMYGKSLKVFWFKVFKSFLNLEMSLDDLNDTGHIFVFQVLG